LSEIPDGLRELVATFKDNRDVYISDNYNETQLRREFVDKFFKLLGWDIDNSSGYAEAYKDVVHEDSLKIDGSTKAPDYSFRIGGTRKFFVETKKPATRLKSSFSSAFQLKRYAWSAKLPISILTNFDEFVVYDCRKKPDKVDAASAGRILYVTAEEFLTRWDEIASVFSRDAVLKGSFDKYAVGAKGRRGTEEVDAVFLEEIETWRLSLATSIARENPKIKQDEVNFVVQQTIDRIIFLRICEDRGIEEYGTLQGLAVGPNVYKRLKSLYLAADNKYNSGLFHFRAEKGRAEGADRLSLTTEISDSALRGIFKRLYYPDSPYEFAVIPPAILGQVYERFLGRVISLTAAHKIKIDEKPDVKKAGGVFYTPSFVVESMTRDCLEPLVSNKKRAQMDKVRILDPACGSGSFLIVAYQFLLDWYLRSYVSEGPRKFSSGVRPRLYQTNGGAWRLTVSERKRILLNSIFGVDVDPQAVEVSKLSLLVKVLEGESSASVSNEMLLIHERALPDLAQNIKSGNTLIEPSASRTFKVLGIAPEVLTSVNPFSYRDEFASIFSDGGFDVVIGNPPWGSDIDAILPYLHERYAESTQQHTDSFKCFTERALELLKPGGVLSYIVPSTLLRQGRFRDVRELLLNHTICRIVDLGESVFKGVVAPAATFVIKKQRAVASTTLAFHQVRRLSNADRQKYLEANPLGIGVLQRDIFANAEHEFMPALSDMKVPCVQIGDFEMLKLKDAGVNYQRVGVGMQVKGKSDLADRLMYEGSKKSSLDVMLWKGGDIDRYWVRSETDTYVRPYYKKFIRSNEVVHLSIETYSIVPKILIRQTSDRVIAAIDDRGIWFGRSVIALLCNHREYRIEYFLGLLNSRYFEWIYDQIVAESGRVFAQVKLSKLKQLPIRVIDFANPGEKKSHDEIVGMVAELSSLACQLRSATIPHKAESIRRRIIDAEWLLNRVVYDLYGVSADEAKTIEASLSPPAAELMLAG
jgi:SAM-dependent methyltransferase